MRGRRRNARKELPDKVREFIEARAMKTLAENPPSGRGVVRESRANSNYAGNTRHMLYPRAQPRSGNALINRAVPRPLRGSNPSAATRFLIDHGKNIGRVVGAVGNVPGAGFLAGQAVNQYWRNNQQQSPATNLPPTGNEMINNSLRETAQQSPAPTSNNMMYRTTLGSWYGFQPQGGGNMKWIHSRSLALDN